MFEALCYALLSFFHVFGTLRQFVTYIKPVNTSGYLTVWGYFYLHLIEMAYIAYG